MDLFEYEGKCMMNKFGIPIPTGSLITSENEKPPMAVSCILKAQVMTGGRGKAGGVKVCNTMEEYMQHAHSILNMSIKGHPVCGLLAEEIIKADRELYLSITLQGVKVPTLIASKVGGMDIEKIAKEEPEKIIKIEIDPFTGLKDYQIRYLADKLEIADVTEAAEFVKKVEKAFFESGAKLVEINPLGLVDGRLIAMDSKFVLDDYGTFMKSTGQELLEKRKNLYHYIVPEKEKTTVTFVPLAGDVGLISDGAGTGMLTLDLLVDEGIEVSSFGELGGMTSPEVMYRALELTFQNNPDVKALIIVLIGGFNRMDNMAVGITSYMKEHHINIPVFCRMCGTKQEEGIRIMEEYGLKTYDILTETVKALVSCKKEGF